MYRILIIEDDRFNRRLYRDLLEAEGHAVSLAAGADEGIASARANPPSLIVMDIELPDMDGLEATRVLKGLPALASVPIIVISAHALHEHEAMALKVGDAFMRKPLRFPEFQQTIMRLLGAGAG